MRSTATAGRRFEAETIGIVCRRLWSSDRQALRDHVLRLDPETRANRFMSTITDAQALAYADRSLGIDGLTFGVFVDGALRGLGELRPTGGASFGPGGRAEAAFAVEREFRREGLGSMLFRRMVAASRSRGIADLQMRCLHGNRPMHRLALRAGADLHPLGFETEGEIRLAWPTPFSLWSEGVSEALDLSMAVIAAADNLAQAASPGHATMR